MGCLSPRRMLAEARPQPPAIHLGLSCSRQAVSGAKHAQVQVGGFQHVPTACMQVRAQQGSAEVLALAHSELLWRDFFRFTAKKYASAPLQRQGASWHRPASAAAQGCRGAQPAAVPRLALAFA